MTALVFLVLVVFVVALPCYVIAQRRRVPNAWVAFIPFVGPGIVLLWSIERSGWMCLLGLIPIVNLVYTIWLLFSIPAHQGRTRWWGLALLCLPVIGFYLYAFTLRKPAQAALALS